MRRAIAGICCILALHLIVDVGVAARAGAAAINYNSTLPTIPNPNHNPKTGSIFLDKVPPNPVSGALGTITNPYTTLANALAASEARGGGMIAIRGCPDGSPITEACTYRESVDYVGEKVTFQAYPHEQVWFKGSELVSGPDSGHTNAWTWSATDHAWVNTFHWTFGADYSTTNPAANYYVNPGAIDPNYPAAGKPTQVFVNGVQQKELNARPTGNSPGTFYVDTSTAGSVRVLLGSATSPDLADVEITDRPSAIRFTGASGSGIVGLGFTQFATSWNSDYRPGAVLALSSAKRITFDSSVFYMNASNGAGMYSPGGVVKKTQFISNGFTGLQINEAKSVHVTDNTFAFNNGESFRTSGAVSAVAGVKITRTQNTVIARNVVLGNNSNGIWCDIECYNDRFYENYIYGNSTAGLYYEVSAQGDMYSNVVAYNGTEGIKISGSNHLEIFNNTLVGNGIDLALYEDGRWAGHSTVPLCTGAEHVELDCQTHDVRAYNNIMSDAPQDSYLLYTMDTSGLNTSSGSIMLSLLNYNAYHRSSVALGSGTAAIIIWERALASAAKYTSLGTTTTSGAFRHDYAPRENNAVSLLGVPASSVFAGASSGDYRLASGSTLINAGMAIDPKLAKTMGVPASPVSIGALKWASPTGGLVASP